MTTAYSNPDGQGRPSDHQFVLQLILQITRALVNEIGVVTADVRDESGSTTIVVKVAACDIGKVIGKQGRTARSIRTILNGFSSKTNQRYALDIRGLDSSGREASASRLGSK